MQTAPEMTQEAPNKKEKKKKTVGQEILSWVFSFAGRVKILGPEQVAQEYREMCRKASE